MTKRMLPIGMQTFRELRERDCYYVDKTPYIRRMVDEGKHYFLSRPRRFGKSLFLDTLKELFEGNEPLFKGLAIHDAWDWSVRHPVIRLSFGGGNFAAPGGLEARLMDQLADIEGRIGLDGAATSAAGRLYLLIAALHERTGRSVVVLVDEYDKPILDALAVPDVAKANRDYLHGVYGVVKDCDAHIRFTFVTGVSKFSPISLFSGLNNLIDITMERRFSSICGYSDRDLDVVFAPELPGLDRQAIREWYDGYSWRGDERVYNPFDILLLFRMREFKAHWFETGSPTFLVDTLFERRVSSFDLEDMIGTDELLSTFDVGDIATEALLFQTGYLTIAEERNLGGMIVYRLGYPNRGVKQNLNEHLLWAMGADSSRQGAYDIQLFELLSANDFEGLAALFRDLFVGIPDEWHTNNDIANYEGYYASVFYSCFAVLGLNTTVEDSSAQGRLDMVLRFNESVYLFEFKVVESASESAALQQLKERRYADKYRSLGQPIHLVGVEFSKESRNLVAMEVEHG